jgi:hypothetical protein
VAETEILSEAAVAVFCPVVTERLRGGRNRVMTNKNLSPTPYNMAKNSSDIMREDHKAWLTVDSEYGVGLQGGATAEAVRSSM